MQHLLDAIRSGTELSRKEIFDAVTWLADPAAVPEAKCTFLEGLRNRGETAAEIAAFVEALLERALDPEIKQEMLPGPMLDVCGTGGDRLELFNVSTTCMFVLSAGGAAVVKHGNRAITSQCGGADVLEALGIPIELAPDALREQVYRHGLGFVFAPAYHPTFATIAPVRRALAQRGVATVFNLLGPLLNPARPSHQLVGVYAPDLLSKYAQALRCLGRRSAWAVHGSGADELTLAGAAQVIAVENGALRSFSLEPESLGFAHAPVSALRGGNRSENAAILEGILSGTLQGPPLDAVVLNSAAGFVVAGLEASMAEGVSRAREAIASGAALAKLNALRG
ncbi:MAG: anthranilate phosphoribosyltransferase [Verrucomicrobia bacterium]|nr:anthranilate phosphoribosyltransferase [Verrucomicrobiota bacterium]